MPLPPTIEDQNFLRTYLQLFRKRRWTIISVFLIVVAMGIDQDLSPDANLPRQCQGHDRTRSAQGPQYSGSQSHRRQLLIPVLFDPTGADQEPAGHRKGDRESQSDKAPT